MVDLKFDAGGLLPVVAQDAGSGLVLMVAYMNREALDRTLSSGDVPAPTCLPRAVHCCNDKGLT